jgi:hypothetical protein
VEQHDRGPFAGYSASTCEDRAASKAFEVITSRGRAPFDGTLRQWLWPGHAFSEATIDDEPICGRR